MIRLPAPSSEEGERSVSGLAHSFQEALRGTVAPIREQLAEIERVIAEREEELRELRALRTAANRLIGVIEPEEKPKAKPKAGEPGRPKAAAETLDAVLAYLREHHRDGDGFSAPSLADEHAIGKSRATLAIALRQLADSGVIRLDRVGEPYRTKIYKLVAP